MAAAAAASSSSSETPLLHTAITPCRGYDDWSHRVFLTTNETRTQKTIKTMKTQNVVGNAMMGVSGFFTLNMAAVRGTLSGGDKEIEHIVLFDRSLRVEHFWQEMKTIMSESSTREEVIRKVKQLLKDNKDRYFSMESGSYDPQEIADEYIQNLEIEIQNGESWLSDDIKFARIKRIFDRGNFDFLRLDLTDPTGFEALQEQFAEREITVDSIYLSNTSEYMGKRQEVEACTRSVTGLIQPSTLVVDTAQRGCHNCDPLVQRVRRRNESPVSELFQLRPPSQCRSSSAPQVIVLPPEAAGALLQKLLGQNP